MKLLTFFLACILLFATHIADAQMDKQSKKQLKKVEKYYNSEKYDKSAELMREILNKYPISGGLWNMYQEITYQQYRLMKPLNFTVSVKSSDGKQESDSLSKAFTEMMSAVLQKPKYDYYNALYYATITTPYQERASSALRSHYVDVLYYSNNDITSQSKAYFDKAEGEFQSKNYQKAAEYFQKSYDADTSNFKALLYTGDSYYALKYYGKAADYFRQSMQKQPLLLEPVKYLCDALSYKGEYEKALEVAKNSLLVYPDETMFIKISRLLETDGVQKVNRNWVTRLASAASINDKRLRKQFFNDILHFKHYNTALEEVKEYYDEKGLLKADVDKPLDRYLEVHCWKKMLEATADDDIPILEYSRKLEKEGMLAPYLLIGLFNVDLYDQYRDLVENKPEIVHRFINEYLISAEN